MEWTRQDIVLLHNLLQDGQFSMSDIARICKRSRSATLTAARKIIFQQMLHHTHEEVAVNYGFDSVEQLRDFFHSEKYYVPPNSAITRDHDDTIPAPIYMVVGILFATGLARFGHVLAQNVAPLLGGN